MARGAGRRTAPSLLMVGTVHRDPRGRGRLLGLLARARPSAISVEISPYAREFRARGSAALRARLRENLRRIGEEEGFSFPEMIRHQAIQEIFLLLKMPYEWAAARAYADLAGCRLRAVDLSAPSKEKLSHLAELVSRENLLALLRGPSPGLAGEVEAHYRRARFLFAHPPAFWSRGPESGEREAFMAEHIRALALEPDARRVVHIGGWEHLLDLSGEPTLYRLLIDLKPRRILLGDGRPGRKGGTGETRGRSGPGSRGGKIYPQDL